MALQFPDQDLGEVLVIGGCGWVGSRLTQQLSEAGYKVLAADVRPPARQVQDVEYVRLDITSASDTAKLVSESRATTIFHLASLVDIRPYENQTINDVNVEGTRNVVSACIESKWARRLIYTSSIDVCAEDTGMSGVSETAPYAKRPHSNYQISKIEAEKIVLAANNPGDERASPVDSHATDDHIQRLERLQNKHGVKKAGSIPESRGQQGRLATIALRPAHIWGDDDPVLDFATQVPVQFTGSSKMSMQFVDNVAHAHVVGARQLAKSPSHFGGEAFFFSDFATNFQEFYFELAGKTPVKVPQRLVGLLSFLLFRIAAVVDMIVLFLDRLGIRVWSNPTQCFTVGALCEVYRDLYCSGARSMEQLGYTPLVSKEEGMRRAKRSYAEKKGHVRNWIA